MDAYTLGHLAFIECDNDSLVWPINSVEKGFPSCITTNYTGLSHFYSEAVLAFHYLIRTCWGSLVNLFIICFFQLRCSEANGFC